MGQASYARPCRKYRGKKVSPSSFFFFKLFFFLYLFINLLFIYFWLHRVLVVACRAGSFVAAHGLLSSCGVRAQ